MQSPAAYRVSRETQEALDHYLCLLAQWQKRINLVGPSTVPDARARHIDDSLRLFELYRQPLVWADIGSGAGFPGLVTAICLKELGDGWVHLVESNNKKAAFLRQVILETNARASVHVVRIESSYDRVGPVQAVSARALSDLSDLLELSFPWLSASGCFAAYHKGRDFERELNEARGRFGFDLVKHDSRVATESVILELRNVARL
ncbi:16S rRNA (guanine527-N7)-methyltransferase [Rhizobium sp. RU20A]|uniref:16S rRNA (guanine(527)-N(7))-methyltransferase RsmG n=1 Tax=Rhizobium sp. RU20A TaxID=1907412 RepID=UPI000954C265|nr:16S rRNA (guanine(527)-N(7))-methyltransferase RsmG [Rhizobium sp. RU20A]SIQ84756.1 16S rRNA (guanine527-N7)-methyltransferase [Rhizobium sp. RU20A]